jgi:hypothetical protein
MVVPSLPEAREQPLSRPFTAISSPAPLEDSMTRISTYRTPFILAALCAAALAAVVTAPCALAGKDNQKEVWKGQPEYNKGESRGYFIWGDDEGWHVRWMSKGAKHIYSGNVTSDVGLDKFHPVSRDSKDFIKPEGNKMIRFDAKAKEVMDGFNFHASPSTHVLRFELNIDGKKAPVDEVKLGRNKTRASAVPVVINLGGDANSKAEFKTEAEDKAKTAKSNAKDKPKTVEQPKAEAEPK